MATTLAFNTPPVAVSIPAGKSHDLGTVDVHTFDRIRVLADQRPGSAASAVILLYLLADKGALTVGLLDTLTLKAGDQITKVYETPGTMLSIVAILNGASGSTAGVDVWVWGSAD
jgi:type III secretion protein HrpB1